MAAINNKIKLDFSFFSIQIFVIGGNNGNGEGILILFLNGSKVIHTISIDCCKAIVNGSECNLLDKILKKYDVHKIDCFVWTHPHDDHSNGLDELVDIYYRKGSVGIIPKQIYGTDNDIVTMRSLSKKVLRRINFKFKKKCLKSIDCQSKEKRCVYFFELEDILSGQIKNVSLFCLTPIDYMLDDKRRNQKKINDGLLNDISLSLILDVDGYCFFFGGDAPDRTLKESDTGSLLECKWVKIPHHGSKTSQNVVQYFNNNIDSAVAASFMNQHLPSEAVLNKYKDKTSQIYVTQKTKDDPYDFGMIGYHDIFSNNSVQLNVTRYGNAFKY